MGMAERLWEAMVELGQRMISDAQASDLHQADYVCDMHALCLCLVCAVCCGSSCISAARGLHVCVTTNSCFSVLAHAALKHWSWRRHLVCIYTLEHLQAIPFLREVLFREAMVSMRQWQFKWLPPPVLDMLKTVFQGWCQSETCENGFNAIKDHQRDTKSTATSRIQRHLLPHVEGVMEQFGRLEL